MFQLRNPGESLPGMTLYDLEGQPHVLHSDVEAGPVLLFFWSVYCPNCKEALPDLVALHHSENGAGLKIWAVNVDGERFSNGVRAFVRDAELPFPGLCDRLEGEYLVAADPLGISKTPSMYLAGRGGTILDCQIIELDFGRLREALKPETD
jgi:peroxiredoxin